MKYTHCYGRVCFVVVIYTNTERSSRWLAFNVSQWRPASSWRPFRFCDDHLLIRSSLYFYILETQSWLFIMSYSIEDSSYLYTHLFTVVPLALGKSYDCPGDSEVSLNNKERISSWQDAKVMHDNWGRWALGLLTWPATDFTFENTANIFIEQDHAFSYNCKDF